MTAVEIIDEIKHLSPGEQARVVHFVRTLGEARQLSGRELNELAESLAGEKDSTKAGVLKERIVSGFYGEQHSA